MRSKRLTALRGSVKGQYFACILPARLNALEAPDCFAGVGVSTTDGPERPECLNALEAPDCFAGWAQWDALGNPGHVSMRSKRLTALRDRWVKKHGVGDVDVSMRSKRLTALRARRCLHGVAVGPESQCARSA